MSLVIDTNLHEGEIVQKVRGYLGALPRWSGARKQPLDGGVWTGGRDVSQVRRIVVE